MRISDDTLSTLLIRSDIASESQLTSLKEEASRTDRSLQTQVLESKLLSERDLTKLFADYADIPFIEIDPRDIPTDTLNKIPERIARQYNAVVFNIDETGVVHLAMDDPDDVQAVSFIEKEIGTNTKIYVAP